jgi:5-formyltetrahydrofolate cyclo-ligase
MTKKEIRKEKLQKRSNIENREEKNLKILKNLSDCEFFKKACRVMVYISYRDEVDTKALIEEMLSMGKSLCAPVCQDSENMIAREFFSISDLVSGAYGIPEPKGKEIKDIDLVIVPGVAFCEEGFRIGYGAGYYDRFLKKSKAVTCGLFFEEQKCDFLPESHDKKLDYIVTEEKIYS